MCSGVCSSEPHSQWAESARPSLFRCFLSPQWPVRRRKMVVWVLLSRVLVWSFCGSYPLFLNLQADFVDWTCWTLVWWCSLSSYLPIVGSSPVCVCVCVRMSAITGLMMKLNGFSVCVLEYVCVNVFSVCVGVCVCECVVCVLEYVCVNVFSVCVGVCVCECVQCVCWSMCVCVCEHACVHTSYAHVHSTFCTHECVWSDRHVCMVAQKWNWLVITVKYLVSAHYHVSAHPPLLD